MTRGLLIRLLFCNKTPLTDRSLDTLRNQIAEGADKQALHAAMDALDTLSRPFAQRVMEDALRTAMVGKGVGEVE